MRPFVGELVSALSICAVIAVLTLEMPSAAYSFRARPDEQSSKKIGASAAYVFMDAQTEAFFLRKAKDTWRKGGSEYADLSVFDLPEERRQSVLTLESRSRPRRLPRAACRRFCRPVGRRHRFGFLSPRTGRNFRFHVKNCSKSTERT